MTVLRDLIVASRDGEWGRSEPDGNSVLMHVVRGTDFEDVRLGSLDAVPQRYIAQKAADRKLLRPWDIILETAGGSKDRPTGRTVLLKPSVFAQTAVPITCASFARFLRIDPEKADPEFVFWMLQGLYADQTLRKFHTQHTGVARFQFTVFADGEPLPLPPLPTQRRIASILSAYDDLIENNTRRIAILEEMARRIYEEWFVHFRLPGHESVKMVETELGMVPDGWRVQPVKSFVNRLPSGPTFTQATVRPKGVVPVVDQSRAELLGFHDGAPAHQASPTNPIVIFGDHTCKMQVMITPFSLGPNTIPFVGKEDYPVHYVYSVVSGIVETHEYKRHWTELIAKTVVIAPRPVARQFADTVSPTFQLAENLRSQNANLRAQRDLLLPKLISGEIDVSELPDAAALEAAE